MPPSPSILEHARTSPRPLRWAGGVCLVLALCGAALADAPNPPLLRVGSVAGAPGDQVAVPVILDPKGTGVASLDFVLRFDDETLAFLYSEPGDVLLGTGKLIFADTVDDGELAVVVTGTLEELDAGTLFTLYFAIDPEAERGWSAPLVPELAGAATPLANPVFLDIAPGGVSVDDCPAPEKPAWVEASQGTYRDRVVVEWAEAAGAFTYTVLRGTSESPDDASVLASGVTATRYVDWTAAHDGDPGGDDDWQAPNAMGCAAAAKALTRSGALGYRYWVVAENWCGESAPAGPARGWTRGDSADDRSARADGGALVLAAGVLALCGLGGRVARARTRRRGEP